VIFSCAAILYDFKEVSGSPMSARLSLELELRDTKTGIAVWTHPYNHDEPVSGKDVSAVVNRAQPQRAARHQRIQRQLSQYFSAHPPARRHLRLSKPFSISSTSSAHSGSRRYLSLSFSFSVLALYLLLN